MAVLPPDPIFKLRNLEMGPLNCLCFHQTERLFAGTQKGMVYLWDLQTNRTTYHFQLDPSETSSSTAVSSAAVRAIVHRSDDDHLITQQHGSNIKLWKLIDSNYKLTDTINTEHVGYCRIQYVEERNLLMCPKYENQIDVYNIKSGTIEHQQSLIPTINLKLGQLMCMKYLQILGQSYILAGYESGHFLTWDLRCSKVINMEQFQCECPIAIDYDELTNRGIFGDTTNQLGIFKYERDTMEIQHSGNIIVKNAGINCIKIRNDQKVFATGGTDGRIRIFSWKSLRPLAVLTEHNASIIDIAYSKGKVSLWKAPIMAVAGQDGQISLWNLYN